MATKENRKLFQEWLDTEEWLEKPFTLKCSVKVVSSGEHCPEEPTKHINGDPVCDMCYENWKHLEKNK